MPQGLAVSDVIDVTVSISPVAVPTRNFGAGILIGSTDVIDVFERMRRYSSIEDIGGDFGTTDPEYAAAARFFSQDPQPSLLYVGRWARTATRGVLRGGVLTSAEKLLSAWTTVTSGGFKISIDGTEVAVSGLNFSSALSMPGVAAIIDAGLAGASVTWDANSGRFVVKSDTTGVTSTVSYATAPASGTNISGQLKLTSALAGTPVAGKAAETLQECLQALVDKSGDWYAAVLVPSDVDTSVVLAASEYVEALNKKRILGATITSTTVLDNTLSTDLASVLQDNELKRSFVQYSAENYAVASFFGRAATVDFTGNRTALTMKFKTEPGVSPETLTETQASTLKSKNCNVFVNYDNSTAIIQEGVMSNGYFFDEVHGLDWLENYIQTEVWNLLYTSKTKVPQTNAGSEMIASVMARCLNQGVENGLIAPGQWNADGFGTLERGQYLESGYYIYYPDISTQSQADREARKSVPFQIAVKLAGAVHYVRITVNVNR